MRPDPIRRAGAEELAAFALVFAGCGAIVADAEYGGALGTVGIALAFGLVIMVMVYAIGHLSGAHINPAVTLAFALTGFGTACVIPAIFALTAQQMSENRARALGIVALVAGLPRVMAPWFFGWIATLHSTSFAFGLCAVAMAMALGFILLLQMLIKRTAAPVRTPAL